MKHLIALLLTINLILNAIPTTHAQSPNCTNQQITAAVLLLDDTGWIDDYTALILALEIINKETGLGMGVLEQAHTLQVEFWGEIASQFPNCTEAHTLKLLVGRLIDETLIMIALADYAFFVDGAGHTDEYNQILDYMRHHRDQRETIADLFDALATE